MKTIAVAGEGRFPLFTEGLRFEEFLNGSATDAELLRKRLQEVRLTRAQQLRLSLYPDTLHFLVLLGADDPDTVAVLPILAAMVAASPRLDLRIIADDGDLSWVSQAADEVDPDDDLNDMDLPLLLIFDEEWTVQESWGPRPEQAEAQLDAWLETRPQFEELADDESEAGQAAYAKLLEELTHTMRLWYNSGVAEACVDEILALLDAILRNEDEDEDEDEDADASS